jgi:ubiquinone biosynthesis protein
VAETIVQAILARPLFATTAETMFHADPHAGNLLYNARTKQIVILDWALTGTLTLEQRRHLTVFLMMVMLRDRVGTCEEVFALSVQRLSGTKRQAVRRTIGSFIDELPVWRMPDSMDAMSLLQKLAFETVRLPGSLILLRKVMFTLEGVVEDVVGKEMAMDTVLVRSLFWRWLTRKIPMGAPLEISDWLRVQTSTLLSGSRWMIAAAQGAIAG